LGGAGVGGKERRIAGGRRKEKLLRLEQRADEDAGLGTTTTTTSTTTAKVLDAEPITTPPKTIRPDLTVQDLISEQTRLIASLQICLERPDQSWLIEDSIEDSIESNGTDSEIDGQLDEEALLQVITTMMLTRDDMEARTKGHLAAAASDDGGGGAAPQYSQEEIVGELREMERTVASIASLAVVSAGSSAARMLEDELLGRDGSRSLLAGLDRLVEEIEAGRLERRKVDGGTQEETAPGLYDNDSTAYDVADGDRYDTTEGTEPFLESRTVKNGNREWNAAGAPIVDFPPSGAEVVIDGYDDIYDDGEDAATTSVFVPDVIASDNNENTSGGRRSGPRRTTTLIDADVEFIVSGLDAYVTVTPDEEALRETGAGAGAGSSSGSVYATPDVELVLDDDDDALLMQNAKSLDVASIAVE